MLLNQQQLFKFKSSSSIILFLIVIFFSLYSRPVNATQELGDFSHIGIFPYVN